MGKRTPFRWNTDDELYPELELALHEATLRGYSVVELSRILGNSGSRHLYEIMRNAGIIAKLPKGRTPKIVVPPGLQAALKERELSFNRWVNTHELKPFEVASALAAPVKEDDPISVAAHKAFRQDFRHLYCKCYRLPAEPDLAGNVGPANILTDYSVSIIPDKDNDRYKAFIVELPHCCGYGADRMEALDALRSRYVLFHSIRKLKVLPDKHA